MKQTKTFPFIVAVVTLAVVAGLVLRAPRAEANFLGDFLRGLVAPFLLDKGGTSAPVAPPQLYKPALEYERAVIDAVKKASPAVVSITISKNVPVIERCPINPFGDLPPEFQQFFGSQIPQLYGQCARGTRLQEVGGGSGFVISPNGLILTNKHVVSDKAASYTVFTNDGKKYDAEVLARDPVQDLAVVRIKAVDLHAVELGDSDALELGQTAIAIGNALGEFRNTVSVGVISGLARTVTAEGGGTSETIEGVIQTDAAINLGNSGGPLLNLRGQVVGINTAVASGAENIGFAIPLNRAKRDIRSVQTTGEIQTAYLGVRYVLVTPELAKKEKLPVDYGALVRGSEEGPAVMPDSPAAKAGIRAEDVIVEVNGKRVGSDGTLGSAISQLGVGDIVKLKVIRGGKELLMDATLAKRPE